MVIEKIKQLHAEFGKINNDQASNLGFSPRIEDEERLKRFLRKGKWSALNFSILSEIEWAACVKIVPDIPGSQWPVYNLFSSGAKFYASDMLSYLLLVHIERLNKNLELCERYSKEWDGVYEIVSPVYKLFGGSDDLQDIRDIVFDKKKWPKAKDNKEDIVKKYRAFCLKRDPGLGNKRLWELLDNLINSEDFLPELSTEDLGIYTSRINKLTSVRAVKLLDDVPFKKLEKLIFAGFMEPHGYDTADMYPDYYPSKGAAEKSNIMSVVENIFDNTRGKNSTDLKVLPEYQVAKALFKQGAGNFKATEFLQAARGFR